MVKYWLVNHNWVSFSRTQEYCGFSREWEQKQIQLGDKIVYFGDGLVLGLFEAVALVKNEFRNWQKPYPFQVKIKPLKLANNPPKGGMQDDKIKGKLMITREKGGSPNLVPLTEVEFKEVERQLNGSN